MINSGIATDERKVFEDFKREFNLKDKVILEVGGSIPFELIANSPIQQWVAIDPLNNNTSIGSRYYEVQGIAQEVKYPNDSFDYVFSSNAFHLISELDAALRELYRVLKNGGYLYVHYGPIWSACDGHQLERVYHQGREYIFWRDYLIPHWYHLIFDQDELTQILVTRLDTALVKKVVHHVYQGTWVNRMFYEDYITSFYKSDFTIVAIAGSDTLDYTPTFPDYDHPLVSNSRTQNILATIQQKNGKDKKNIYCRDMKVILRKIE